MDDAKNSGAAESFTNAMLHVSATGWRDNLARWKDGRWNSYVDYAFSDLLAQARQVGRVRLEDNATIFPGIRTLCLGGHSICSQAVLLDTAAGLVIIASDEVYLYRLLEEDILPQIRTSEEQYRAALDRLVRLALAERGIVIASHDPMVWETYQRAGSAWLQAIKPVSDRVVQSYAQRRFGR
jgi:glyoxylase-like metal-dependent hydrolase (beta-lactamase superfamily II)